MAFEDVDKILFEVAATCIDPRIVLGGGGNFSIKEDDLMLIKASGTFLPMMKRKDMAVVRRDAIRELLQYFRENQDSFNPQKREKVYKEMQAAARVDPKGPRPSVETAAHELFPKYVLHTHPTALTALSSVLETPDIIAQIYPGLDHAIMQYLDPGILLGTEAMKMFEAAGHVPKAFMQRNHGFFFASDDFREVMDMHHTLDTKVRGYINRKISQKDFEKSPFGESPIGCKIFGTDVDYATMMYTIYRKVFEHDPKSPILENVVLEGMTMKRMKTEEGSVYLDTSHLAKSYAESLMAKEISGRFTWLSPDHIVAMNMNTDYIALDIPNNGKRVARDISEQVQKHENGKYSRVFVIRGVGIATAGGFMSEDTNPDYKASLAMQFVNDALLIYRATRAIGTLTMLTKENGLFIDGWEVEKERRKVAQQQASK